MTHRSKRISSKLAFSGWARPPRALASLASTSDGRAAWSKATRSPVRTSMPARRMPIRASPRSPRRGPQSPSHKPSWTKRDSISRTRRCARRSAASSDRSRSTWATGSRRLRSSWRSCRWTICGSLQTTRSRRCAACAKGQRADVHVDALEQTFRGHIESLPAATGARFSLLPPENATGNYVKVVQRLPVRIRLEPGQANLDRLRPGMSVEPKVWLE